MEQSSFHDKTLLHNTKIYQYLQLRKFETEFCNTIFQKGTM